MPIQWIFPVGHFILVCEKHMSRSYRVKTRAGKKGSSLKPDAYKALKPSDTPMCVRQLSEDPMELMSVAGRLAF